MNLCNKILLLISYCGIALSCGDVTQRFDPIEAGRYVFDLRNFAFLPYYVENSPEFKLDSWGDIDRDERRITCVIPPSIILSAKDFRADMLIENVGTGDSFSNPVTLTQNWLLNNKVRITKSFAGFSGDEEPYYQVEYDVHFKKELYGVINSTPDSASDVYPYHYYFTTTNPNFEVRYNDDIIPASLGAEDFQTGFTAKVIQPSLTEDFIFQVEPDPANSLTEGIYNVRNIAGSCEASTPGYFNRGSNLYTFAYDENPPQVANPLINVGGSNFTTSVAEDVLLRISFDSAADSLTPAGELEYKICYTTTLGNIMEPTPPNPPSATVLNNMYYATLSTPTEYYIPVDGKEWFTYQSPLSFSYDDLPAPFRANLVDTQSTYINIIVRDNCHSQERSNVYNHSTVTYDDPSIP